MKRILRIFGLFLPVCGFGLSVYGDEPQDLMAIIVAASPGKTRAALALECASGGAVGKQYANNYGPNRCFDGIKYSTSDVNRYLGQITANASGGTEGGAYVQLNVPNREGLSVYKLVAYEVHRLSAGWNALERAPTKWKLEGSLDGIKWQTIDEREGVSWSAAQANESDCMQTFAVAADVDVAFRHIRFTPLASNLSGSWDVGLNELVYKVVPTTVVISEPQNITTMATIAGVGYTVSGTEAASGYGPEKLFDGKIFSNNESDRWVCNLNATAVIKVNDAGAWQSWEPQLVEYRLYQHTTANSCNSRAPTAWTLEGSLNGTEWETIDEVEDFRWVSQSGGAQYNTGTPAAEKSPYELGEPTENSVVKREVAGEKLYIAYRFTPTASLLTGNNAAGLMEIELMINSSMRAPVLCVQGNLDSAVVEPAYGNYQAESKLCTAAEYGFETGIVYRCVGYTKEVRAVGEEEWSEAEEIDELTFAYERGEQDVRITWRWVPVGVALTMRSHSGSGDTFTFDADYYHPAEPNVGYYDYNSTAQVTIHPASEPTSTFSGEIFGDVEGVTVSGEVLTVPMGMRPRTIEVGFHRHWHWSHVRDAAGNTTAIDQVTDGNWTINITPYLSPIAGYAAGEGYRLAEINADGFRAYVSGSGTLDLTYLNDDLALQGKMPLIRLNPGSFVNVSQLTELIVPANIPTGLHNPFGGCKNLKRVVWHPDSELFGGDNELANPGCFEGCTALESVVATNLTRLPPRFFSGCTALTNVVFGARLGKIASRAFENCTGFAQHTLVLPSSLTNFTMNTANPARAQTFNGAKFDTLDFSQLRMETLPPGVLNGCQFREVRFNKRMKNIEYPNIQGSLYDPLPRYVFGGKPPTTFGVQSPYGWTVGIVAPKNLLSAWTNDSRFVSIEQCKDNGELQARTTLWEKYVNQREDPTCIGGWNDELLFVGDPTPSGIILIFNKKRKDGK